MAVEAPWYAALPAPGEPPSPRWRTRQFAQELRHWAGEHVGLIRRMEQVHLRPWSTLWRFESEQGVFFAKENCAHQSFEARLMATLSRLEPSRVVPVSAVDEERGRLLTPDQGAVLGDTIGDDDVDAWVRVVVAAMELQRQLAPHVDELAAAGLRRLRARDAAAYVTARTASLAALPHEDPRRLEPEQAEPMEDLEPRVREWAEQVEGLGLPDALVHNDLHAYNVFDTPEGLRFFDFGDAVIMHPLAALLIPLNVMAHRLDAFGADPRLWRVADAGLEVWSDVAPARELRAALPAALQLGRLGRIESWARVCATMTPDELEEYGDAAAAWLQTLRLDPPTGWEPPPA